MVVGSLEPSMHVTQLSGACVAAQNGSQTVNSRSGNTVRGGASICPMGGLFPQKGAIQPTRGVSI